jgi:F-type H+-transporting ATPase subunit gamma
MQLVSAAKMRKAQNATLASRTYADLAFDLTSKLGNFNPSISPLLAEHPEAKKVGIILVTTNRGLVGGFNTNLINQVKKIEQGEAELIGELITVGKKGREAMARGKKDLIADFPKHDTTEHIKDIYPLVSMITKSFASGQYREIVLVYNHFVSTLQQQPTVKTLLPFQRGETSTFTDKTIYEPSKTKVLQHLVHRVIESQLYQAILESDASEHSARMVMMKNATEAAGDLIDDLTLTFNQLRQNKITTELSEITAGKIALE